MSDNKELTIIGGGPAGYAAAFLAADLDMDVTLIDEREKPGGVCLYVGCIPSKALLHISKLIEETKAAESFGVKFSKPKIIHKRLREWKDEVIEKLTGGLQQMSKSRKVKFVQGRAVFKDSNSLEITDKDGNKKRHGFKNALIATGSDPVMLSGLSPESDLVMDSTDALELKDIPNSLLVIGGGYIGLEMGSVYASLGSKVTVVETDKGILPGVDRDLVSPLKKSLDDRFENIILNATVAKIKEQKNGLKVTIEGKDVDKKNRIFDKALTAVGRKPSTENIGLENTNIDTDEKGFIKVDDQNRTGEKNIFAAGDVVGEPMLAHRASHEAKTAVEIISGKDVIFKPRAIPAVVYTDPEIAWCGLTENEAKKQGRKIETARFPWAASGRAATFGRKDGVTKLIVDPETERILGVGISGPGAGELIAEGVLAIEMAATVDDLRFSIHPHPTLSETVMETADLYHGRSTHYYRPKKK